MDVNRFILFLHIVGAIAMGMYLLLPFFAGRAASLTGQTQLGYVTVLHAANRVGQFGLIAEFLTGGYLVSKYNMTPVWLILVLLFLIALGAVTGIMGVRMKKLMAASQAGSDTGANSASVRVLSWIAGIFLLVIVFLMNFPNLF
jgi:hypothetical protein